MPSTSGHADASVRSQAEKLSYRIVCLDEHGKPLWAVEMSARDHENWLEFLEAKKRGNRRTN